MRKLLRTHHPGQWKHSPGHSTAATTDRGVTYYTGKVTVESKVKANIANSDYYHMSSFSSWGVPGDLSMKPEITAPGGNIYSVNGAVSETDQYEMMSGTSMATPSNHRYFRPGAAGHSGEGTVSARPNGSCPDPEPADVHRSAP